MSDQTTTIEPLSLGIGPFTYGGIAAGPVDGEPVLLLHGFPQTGSSWRRVLPALAAAGCRAVAPDQRGYSRGARPADDSGYTIEALVGDVVAFADELGWPTFHLVGHDWGGAVAWQVAGRHADRVRTLTVVSTPHPRAFAAAKAAGPDADGDDQGERSSYMQTFRDPATPAMFMAEDRGVLRLVVAGAGMDLESQAEVLDRITEVADIDAALAWYRAADIGDADGLGPITVPTLYVWSTNDVALGRAAADLTAGEVEGPYRFEVLEGVSHWIPEEAPDVLAGLLLEHLGV